MRRTTTATVLASLALAACGGDDEPRSGAPSTSGGTATETTAGTATGTDAAQADRDQAEVRLALAKGAAEANRYCNEHFLEISEQGPGPDARLRAAKDRFVADALAAAEAYPRLRVDVTTMNGKDLGRRPLRRFLTEWGEIFRAGGDIACDPAGAKRLLQAAERLPR